MPLGILFDSLNLCTRILFRLQQFKNHKGSKTQNLKAGDANRF